MGAFDTVPADIDPTTLDWDIPQPTQKLDLKDVSGEVDPTTLDWRTDEYVGPEDPLTSILSTGVKRAGARVQGTVGGLLQRAGESAIESGTEEGSFSQQFGQRLQERGMQVSDEAYKSLLDNPVKARDGSVKYYLAHGTEQLFGNLLPTFAVGAVSGIPAALGTMTGMVYGDKYQQARREGRTPTQASWDGIFYGLTEGVTEALPLGKALALGKAFWPRVFGTAVAEGTTEVLNEIMQRAYDLGIVEDDTTVPEFLRKIADNDALRQYRDALVLGAGTGATVAAAVHPFTGGGVEVTAEQPVGVEEEVIPPITPVQEEPAVEEPTTEKSIAEPVMVEPTVESETETPVPAAETGITVEELDPETYLQEVLHEIEQRNQASESLPPVKPIQGLKLTPGRQISFERTVSNDIGYKLTSLLSDNVDVTSGHEALGLNQEQLEDIVHSKIKETLDLYQQNVSPYVSKAVGKAISFVDLIGEGKFREAQDVLETERSTEGLFHDLVTKPLGLSVRDSLQKGKVTTLGLTKLSSLERSSFNFVQPLLQNWLEIFSPGTSLILAPSSLYNKMFNRTSKAPGSYARLGENVSLILINPIELERTLVKTRDTGPHTLERVLFSVASHEFGHLLEQHEFFKVDKRLQHRIMLDYQRWLKERLYKRGQGGELLKDYIRSRSPHTSLYTVGLERLNQPEAYADDNYWLSFPEYMAEQVSRYANNDSFMQEPVKAFFKKVYESLKKFFNIAKEYGPTQSFKDWLDGLRTDYLLKQLREAEIKNTPTDSLLASGHSDMVAEGLKRVDKVAGGGTELDSSRMYLDNHGEPELTPAGEVTPARALVRFGRWSKLLLALTQIEERNASVPGVKKYTEAVRKWWADKSALVMRADERARELQKLSSAELEAFSRFVHERTIKSDDLGRKLSHQEQVDLARDLNITVTEDMEALLKATDEDFAHVIGTVYDVLEADLPRRYRHLEPVERQEVIKQKLQELQKERKNMLGRNYWPLSRFGQYWVQARATEPMEFQGRKFKTGDIFLFEVFATKEEQAKRHTQLQRSFGEQARVGGSTFSDVAMSFQGMPPQLILRMQKMLEENSGINDPLLTEEERNDRLSTLKQNLTGLDNVLHSLAPGNSFRNRLQRRRRTPGYSMDVVRGYAAYMQGAANHISRIMNYGDMMDAIGNVRDYKHTITMDSVNNEVGLLVDYLQEHYQYAMNPGEEWAQLRAVGFLWYLGFSPKSALVNFTQVPMFTMPYLSKKYGTGTTTKEMARALKDLNKAITEGTDFDMDLQEMVRKGQAAGFLAESLATELAALAEGSNLQRLLPGSFLKSEAAARGVRNASHWGAYMFQKAEQFNRYWTFIASYRMHRQKVLMDRFEGKGLQELTEQEKEGVVREAFLEARTAVEKTQFEYARWNRPAFMRGRMSSLFLFKMYTQNALYFLITDPAKWRYVAMLGVLAGALGLPGAEDAIDGLKVVLGLARRATGRQDLHLPSQAEVRLFLKDLNMNPDLFMHGASRNFFGLWDLSGSIGQGKIIPGMEQIAQVAEGQPFADEKGRLMEQVLGPAWAIPLQLVSSLTSNSPDQWREFEKALPKQLQNMSKAYRLGSRGYASDYSGNRIATEFDITDEQHMLELAGQSLGFIPTRLAQEREKTWAKKETVMYWTDRKRILMQQFSHRLLKGNREATADIEKAIAHFNKTVPDGSLRITGQQKRDSIRRRYMNEQKGIMGRPKGKQGTEIYKQFEEAWSEPVR